MDINKLKTLTVVAKTLHFRKAAEELELTQPAVTYQIRSLEQQLGSDLFIRTSKDVILTEAGRQVLGYANEVFSRIEAMKSDISMRGESKNSCVRLSGNTRSLNSPFPQLRQTWRGIRDDISLEFTQLMTNELNAEAVRNGSTDLGFLTNQDFGDDLIYIPWRECHASLLVSHDHELAKSKKLDAERLQQANWINFDKGWWPGVKFDEICSEFDIRPKHSYETNDGSVVHGLVKDGAGIGILPRWGEIERELESGELVSIEPLNLDLAPTVWVMLRADNNSDNVSRFLEFLLDCSVDGFSNLNN